MTYNKKRTEGVKISHDTLPKKEKGYRKRNHMIRIEIGGRARSHIKGNGDELTLCGIKKGDDSVAVVSREGFSNDAKLTCGSCKGILRRVTQYVEEEEKIMSLSTPFSVSSVGLMGTLRFRTAYDVAVYMWGRPFKKYTIKKNGRKFTPPQILSVSNVTRSLELF